MTTTQESKSEAESLIPNFKLEKILNQDQNGRRITLLGTIPPKEEERGLLILERASFPTSTNQINPILNSLINVKNLGTNDIYRWYMSNTSISSATTSSSSSSSSSTTKSESGSMIIPPDLKINLIYPSTSQHIKKYSPQKIRSITETSEIYLKYILPYIRQQRHQGRLDWVYNILEGRTEQEDVIYRSSPTPIITENNSKGNINEDEGFLLLPDLNWDRKTVKSLHLLAIINRKDLFSLRDLKKRHISWLKKIRKEILSSVCQYVKKSLSGGGDEGNDGEDKIEKDEIKLYLHYQPTYYHLHIHVVHVGLDSPGFTQSVGKAFGLENLIETLKLFPNQDDGMDKLELTYFLGEESQLWKECFGKIKAGEEVTLGRD